MIDIELLKNKLFFQKTENYKFNKNIIKKIIKGCINTILLFILTASMTFFLIFLYECGRNFVKYENDKKLIIENIQMMKDENNNLINDEHFTVNINNFNIDKNTLLFNNFTSIKSSGGNCLGYSIFEKLYFEQKLDTQLYSKDLSDKHINIDDLNNVYEQRQRINNKPKETILLNYEEIVESKNFKTFIKDYYLKDGVIYGLCNMLINHMSEEPIYNYGNLKDKNIDNVLNKITTFQSSHDYSVRFETTPDYFISEINNNKLAIIGVSNHSGGHAVLGYKYEQINNNLIRIYISDSNCPLNNNYDNPKINEYIKNNSYILFYKNNNSEWNYLYYPIYEKENYYTSYLPNNKLFSITL